MTTGANRISIHSFSHLNVHLWKLNIVMHFTFSWTDHILLHLTKHSLSFYSPNDLRIYPFRIHGHNNKTKTGKKDDTRLAYNHQTTPRNTWWIQNKTKVLAPWYRDWSDMLFGSLATWSHMQALHSRLIESAHECWERSCWEVIWVVGFVSIPTKSFWGINHFICCCKYIA